MFYCLPSSLVLRRHLLSYIRWEQCEAAPMRESKREEKYKNGTHTCAQLSHAIFAIRKDTEIIIRRRSRSTYPESTMHGSRV